MSRPNFTAELIGELRQRVIAHNQTPGVEPVKLGQLRQIYTRAYRGDAPDVAAIGKVDGYLTGLAKAAFEDDEHPRAQDGKFADKSGGGSGNRKRQPPQASLPLPATPEEHRALADSNAGYSALQSAVIPETRGAPTGHLIRLGLSAAAGAAVAASLARGRPNGLGTKLAGFAAGQAGRLVSGVGASVTSHAIEGVRDAFHLLPGFKDKPGASAARWLAARQRNARMMAAGDKIGRKLGNASFRGASKTAKTFVSIAGDSAYTPRGAVARRLAAKALIAAPVASAVNTALAATPLDPEQIGAGIDAYNPRVVQKLVMSDEIGAARDVLIEGMRSEAGREALEKVAPRLAGLFTPAGRAALTGIASTAGTLAGAAVGHAADVAHAYFSSKKGNPYHDKSGRFTSRSGASGVGLATGALIGGALGAILTHRALPRRTLAFARPAAQALRGAFQKRQALINRQGGFGGVAQAYRGFDKSMIEAVAAHPLVVAAKKSVEDFGSATPLHFKSRVLDDTNGAIAKAAAFYGNFRIPVAKRGGGGAVWTSVDDLKRTLTGKLGVEGIAQRIKEFAASATPAEFEEAMKNVSAEQRKTLEHFISNREGWVAGVDQQLADHHAKIAAAQTKASNASDEMFRTQQEHADAKAVVDRSAAEPEDVQAAADKAYTDAGATARKAERAAEKANKDWTKLKTDGPTIKSPVDGSEIRPPTELERDDVVRSAEAAARAIEVRKFDTRIKGMRSKQLLDAAERTNRGMGALAVLGEYHGLPRGPVREATAVVARHHRELRVLRSQLSDAQRAHAVASGNLADPAVKGAARRALRASVKDASDTIKDLSGRIAVKQTEAAPHIAELERLLTTDAAKRGLKLLPDQLRKDIVGDISRAALDMKGAVGDFMRRPTMANLLAFAGRQGTRAKGVGTDIAHELFYQRNPSDGSYHLSWVKGVRNAVLAVPAAKGAAELGTYLHDRLSPDSDRRGKAKFPHHLIDFDINPTTGAAYAALAVPHPKENGQKVILWGERQNGYEDLPKRLHAGGRLSQVQNDFRAGKFDQRSQQPADAGEAFGRVHSGDMENMDGGKKREVDEALNKLRQGNHLKHEDVSAGTRVAYRTKDEQNVGGAAAGAVINEIQRTHLKGQQLTGEPYFAALKALTSRQAQALKPNQAYGLLTNTNVDGSARKNQSAIFQGNFQSPDKSVVEGSLRSEIDRAMKMGPNDLQKTSLRRAVHLAGVAKDLSPEVRSSLQERINAEPGAAAGATGRAEHRDYPPEAGDRPPEWSRTAIDNVTGQHARSIANTLNAHHAGSREGIMAVLDQLARRAHFDHDLSLQDSVNAAAEALHASSVANGKEATKDAIEQGFWTDDTDLFNKLDESARRRVRVKKLADLDDFEALSKAFNPSEARISAGQHGGGEFTSGGGHASAGRGAHPTVAAAMQNRVANRLAAGQPQQNTSDSIVPSASSSFHPAHIAEDVAGQVGNMAAWAAVAHFGGKEGAEAIGSAVSKMEPGLLQRGAGLVARFLPLPFAAKMGAAWIASAVGQSVATSATTGAINAGYRAAGAKPPAEAKEEPFGARSLSGSAGAFIGSFAGDALGAPLGPGAVVTQAVGAYVGEKAGEKIYDFFNGYGTKQSSRAMSRFLTPAQSA